MKRPHAAKGNSTPETAAAGPCVRGRGAAPSKKQPARRRAETSLALTSMTLSDDAVFKLINEWIAPSLVDLFLQEMQGLSEPSESEDNRNL